MSNPHQKRLTNEQRKTLRDYIKKNPASTWKEFCTACKSVKISDAFYYMTRREIHGKSRNRGEDETRRRSASPLYLTVWQYPTEKLGTESRAMLLNLLESFNSQKHTHWQLVELKDPAVLELRERSR